MDQVIRKSSEQVNEFAERLGNKIFALETNLENASSRLWNFYMNVQYAALLGEYRKVDEPLKAMQASIEQLKELKGELLAWQNS